MGDEIADKFIEIPQFKREHSPAMHELDRLFRGKEISHPKSKPGRWCFGNVRVRPDGNEDIKAIKYSQTSRIDLMVALICAMRGAMKLTDKTSVYDLRPVGEKFFTV
jgi:phage terminase large subunit-like protein